MSNIEKIKFNERDLLSNFGCDGEIDLIEEREQFLEEFEKKREIIKKI